MKRKLGDQVDQNISEACPEFFSSGADHINRGGYFYQKQKKRGEGTEFLIITTSLGTCLEWGAYAPLI